MSNPEFDNLRRQFCHILRVSATAFRSSALAVEQYANIIEAGGIPSAHDIAQLSSQLPQVPAAATGKSKKKGKDHDGDHAMFEALLAGDDGDSKKRKRGPKKVRDPNAPKRPPSAYLLYQNSVRADTKAKNPEMTYPELLAQISKQWNDLTEDEKKPFVDATAIAKEQYDENKAKYDAQSAAAGGADTVAVVPTIIAAASPSEESDADSPVVVPVVVPTKSPKNKAAEKATNKSPPKDKKKPAPPPEPSESGSDEDASDAEKTEEEEEEEPPRKKAKKGKTSPPPPAKKETKGKAEKSSRRR